LEARVILGSGNTRHEVDPGPADASGTRKIVIDGQTFEVAREGSAPVFRVRVGDQTETLHCVVDGATIHLFWQGRAYRLTREAARAPRPVSGSLEAPMPGKVIAVSVVPGQTVAQGDPLVIVEAMKMETVVRAPRDGRVRAVRVAAGERVAPGLVLIELE
jgi:acetyl/propionyl-CoA carboxylase alpha subunit